MYVIGIQVARLHNIAKKLGRPQGGVVERMENAVRQMEAMVNPSPQYGEHQRREVSMASSAAKERSLGSAAASRRSGQPLPPPQTLEKRSSAASASASSSKTTSNPLAKNGSNKWSLPSFPPTTTAPNVKNMKYAPTTTRNQKSVTAAPEERFKKRKTPARTVHFPRKKHKKHRKPSSSTGIAKKNEKPIPPQKNTSLPVKQGGNKPKDQVLPKNKNKATDSVMAHKELSSRPKKTSQNQHPVTISPGGSQNYKSLRAPANNKKTSSASVASQGDKLRPQTVPNKKVGVLGTESMRPIRRPKPWKPTDLKREEETSPITKPQSQKHPKKRQPSPALAVPSHGETSVAVSAGNGASVAVSAFRRSQDGDSRKTMRMSKRRGRKKGNKQRRNKRKGNKRQKKNQNKNMKKRKNRKRGKRNKRSRIAYRRYLRDNKIHKKKEDGSKQKKRKRGSASVSVSASKGSASVSVAASRRHNRHQPENRKRRLTTPRPRKGSKNKKKHGRGGSSVSVSASKNSASVSAAASRRHHRRGFYGKNRRSAAVSVSASKGSASVSAAASGKRRRRHRRRPEPDPVSTPASSN